MLTWLSANNSNSAFAAVASSPFYCADGGVYHTIRDLANGLVHMSEHTFNHHVHDETNDFANWIEGCFIPPARDIGSHLRGANQEKMVKTLVAIHQSKQAEKIHKDERAQTPDTVATPLNSPASVPLSVVKTESAIRREPINLHPSALPTRHSVTKIVHPSEHSNKLSLSTSTDIKTSDIHPAPLPRSPLHHLHEHRIDHIKTMLHTIQMQAAVDVVEAKESFIELRTKVWRDLDENERKAVMPQLREVYEFLLKKYNRKL
jgi:hypothetical protein